MKKEGEENDLGIQIVDSLTGFVPENLDTASLFLEEGDEPDLRPDGSDPKNGDKDGDGNGDGNGDTNGGDGDGNAQVGDGDLSVSDSNSNITFKDSILRLVKLGLIAPVDEETEFEVDDNGTVVKFKDLDLNSEDDFTAMVEDLFKKKKEELLAGKEDLTGVSELTKKIIEIDKAGGNITSVLEASKKILNPISDLDISKPEDQKVMIAHYLSLRYPDMTDDEINDYVQLQESRGTLATKAEESKKSITDAFDRYTEQERLKAEKENSEKIEKAKEYRKNLKNSLGVFQLKDEYAKKVIDFATKLNDKGNNIINDKYLQMIKDPEQAADLVLFLYDKDEYIRQKTNDAVKQTARMTFKRIAEKSSKSGSNGGGSGGDHVEDEMIDLGKEKLIFK